MESLTHKGVMVQLQNMESNVELVELLRSLTVSRNDFIEIMRHQGVPRSVAAMAADQPFILSIKTAGNDVSIEAFYLGHILNLTFNWSFTSSPLVAFSARTQLCRLAVDVEFTVEGDKLIFKDEEDTNSITLPSAVYKYLESRAARLK